MRRIALLAALCVAAAVALPAAALAKPWHEGGEEAVLTMGGAPPDIRSGDTWTALMLASRGEEPIRHQNIAVTISNARTGRAQTFYSDETAPGRYEARVVFPTGGNWDITAQGGGLVADPPSADVAPASPDPASPWPWVIGGALIGLLLAALVAFGRWPRAQWSRLAPHGER